MMASSSFMKAILLLLLPIATLSSAAFVRTNQVETKIRKLQNQQPLFGDTTPTTTGTGSLFQPGTLQPAPVVPLQDPNAVELTDGDRVLIVVLLPFTITFQQGASVRQEYGQDLGLSDFLYQGFRAEFESIETVEVSLIADGNQASFTGESTFRSAAVVTIRVEDEDVYARQREILTVDILNAFWAAHPEIGFLVATDVNVEASVEEAERYLPAIEPWIIGVTVVVVVIVLAFIILTMPRA